MSTLIMENNYKEILEQDLVKIDGLKREIFFQDTKETSPLISTFLEFVFAKKGKNLRPRLTLLSSKLYGETNRSTYLSSILIDILHEATLLHDDVVDAAQLRRGETSANVVFGNKATVLMGDYLLSKMIEVCTKEKEYRLLEIISTTLVSLSKGELIQMNATKESENSVEQLKQIAALKTGSLLKASCLSGAYSTGMTEEESGLLSQYSEKLGIAYQIKDDIIDYKDDSKELFKDLKEGKVNMPMALALENVDKSTASEMLTLIRDKDNFEQNKETIIEFLNANNGLEKAEDLQEELINEAISIVDELPNATNIIDFTELIGRRKY